MPPTGLPFDDIRALLRALPGPDETSRAQVLAREAELIKPAGALGRLEEIVAHLAAWQHRAPPRINRPLVAIFAGAHGVAKKGVSAYPSEVNKAMLASFSNGQAAINQICKAHDLGLKVFDLAIELPTVDFTEGPALEEAACAATIAFGMEAIANGTDLLCLGEMGIGNTTAAAAIHAALYGGPVVQWVGRGTGVDDAGHARKVAAVEAGLALHRGALKDPLEVLRRLGGREIAAIAGAILAARIERVPVILDGYVATSAAAVLHALEPSSIAHCLAGHVAAEGAHAEVLKRLGLAPILDLGLRLGEGSGAALACAIVKTALACHAGMATFAEAGVPEKV
ncbi:MAG: nicotinate-nucleotide--dimethylbenzimidazole phosphoribosyltransferase [Methylobacterium sp.]|nr:nicotinate-nucleotide--dimethylbenzimidazole phosphoribosyltransferase [Methylobacterium sp.]MCA3657497.1 nicotinate-nucleotide--dimethylbenzimidazole phosphoribosyltransferase [Methylobacterium sp.]MCA3662119.1 nicotinate-nucleotide--dimethylbenzimidazole phosphoribosyltransferase [Methylobacterium sp.]MCA3664190.1 nicotinate-nucleotide--dimethylbenzimidazole phosphoribosyltransferase [Methylobacterium sp.]MCA3666874.1 nicotinate-nucleotide--dimethylbenzimidazole phosphoribosyltransferase [